MPRPQRFAQLPLEISNSNMKALALKDEPMIVCQIADVGNTGRFRQSGRSNRSFLFEYNRADGGHTIRIPYSVWHLDKNAVARELLDQGNRHQVIVTVELPKEQLEKLAKSKPIEVKPEAPKVRLPRHLRHLPQYEGKEVTKKGEHFYVDGKKVSDTPVKGLPQDQGDVVKEVLGKKGKKGKKGAKAPVPAPAPEKEDAPAGSQQTAPSADTPQPVPLKLSPENEARLLTGADVSPPLKLTPEATEVSTDDKQVVEAVSKPARKRTRKHPKNEQVSLEDQPKPPKQAKTKEEKNAARRARHKGKPKSQKK